MTGVTSTRSRARWRVRSRAPLRAQFQSRAAALALVPLVALGVVVTAPGESTVAAASPAAAALPVTVAPVPETPPAPAVSPATAPSDTHPAGINPAGINPARIEVEGVSSSNWLSHLNLYRKGTGLNAVKSEPAWNAGLKNHLKYLAKTPAKYRTGAYISSHTENPKSPAYTKSGAAHAESNLIEGAVTSPVEAIDIWLAAPFHAIGLLRPQLNKVAYADGWDGAILDELSGLDFNRPAARQPVLFPGPGMTTDLASYWGVEYPDPLVTCGWKALGDSAGLPLIALLPYTPSSKLSATVTRSNKTVASTSAGSLCVVSEHTYRTDDPVYGPAGKEILHADNAVLLIAKRTYKSGYYTATIKQPGRADIEWTFGVSPRGPQLGCAGFPDVSAANQFCRHISWFKDQKITKPADGLYHPKSNVNRGSMAAFLFRMTHPGKAQPRCTGKPFPDVAKSYLFCGYIQWAKDYGIAKGYPDGKYRPSNAVTRGAMAAYLHRIDSDSGPTAKCTRKPFKDVAVRDTFCGVITWMKATGITYGVGDGSNYGTTLPVSRESMAAFLKRM